MRSESTSRGFDRARERHGRSAGRAASCGVPMMAAPLYDMMDMAIEFRRDRSPLRARVSSDASLGFFKTTVETNTRRHFTCRSSAELPRSAFLAAASHLPAPAGETRWRPRRPSRPPTRASRVESRSSVSRPASPRRGASAEGRGGAGKRARRRGFLRSADAFVRFARGIVPTRGRGARDVANARSRYTDDAPLWSSTIS